MSKSGTSAAAASSKSATTGVSAKAATPAVKSAVPKNLFATNDSAIIIVGGKPVKAGVVKQAFSEELARLSGPPTTGKTATRLTPATTPKEGRVDPAPALAKGVFWQGPAGTPVALPAYVKPTSARKDVNAPTRGCKNAPPILTEVYQLVSALPFKKTRNLSPGGIVVIEGACFGDKLGTVEMNGQFGQSGRLSLVPYAWKDDQVLVRLPLMRGVLDGTVSVVVALPDGHRTQAEPAKFLAERSLVAVPAHSFSPGPTLERTDTAEGFSSFFGLGNSVIVGTGAVPLVTTPLTISVDPSCSVDSLTWDARVGAVTAVSAWDGSTPPHLVKAKITWGARCTTTTKDYVFSSSTTQSCRIAVDFQATASCPLGIGP